MAKSKTPKSDGAPVPEKQVLFRNRIVPDSLGVKPADQFMVHPLNAKYHPEFQRLALKGVLSEVGYVGPVIESLRSGYLLDGHDRVWVSLETNEDVPFIVVDVTEAEEAYILATFDPLGWLSSHSNGKVTDLLKAVGERTGVVAELLTGVTRQGGAASALLETIQAARDQPDPVVRDAAILEAVSVTLADPVAQAQPGSVYNLGRHVLVVADVIRDWPVWIKFLDSPDALFCPHAGMFVVLSEIALKHKLVIVQPDVWIAGHIIDRYREVYENG